jgi:hypothetical protein
VGMTIQPRSTKRSGFGVSRDPADEHALRRSGCNSCRASSAGRNPLHGRQSACTPSSPS